MCNWQQTYDLMLVIWMTMQVQESVSETGLRVTGQRFWPGRVGSRVSVTDPVSDPGSVVPVKSHASIEQGCSAR